MADAKKKDPEFRTPKCTWKFPKIDKPDYGNKKFPKPKGEYSVQAEMDASAASTKKFLEPLEALHREAVEAARVEFKELKVESRKKLEKNNGKGGIQINDLFSTLYDQETEKPTGKIGFKFAMPASGEYEKNGEKVKWTAKPRIFDATGKPITKVPEVWGGTEGIVAFSARPYFIPGTGAAGLKLKLLAAQITKLVQGGGRDAAGYGFGSEEGGYEHTDSIGDDTSDDNGDTTDTDGEDQTDASSKGEDEDF